MSGRLFGSSRYLSALCSTLTTYTALFLSLYPAPLYPQADGIEGSAPESSVMGGFAAGVNSFSGSFTYSVPIEIPPARGDFAPSVTLNYNSSNRENGLVGVGWSMTTPMIERSTKNGVPQVLDSCPGVAGSGRCYKEVLTPGESEFIFQTPSDQGELLRCSSFQTCSIPRYRTRPINFTRVDAATDYWLVKDGNGNQYIFGDTTDTSLLLPGYNPNAQFKGTFRWYIHKAIDKNGNLIKYNYIKNDNQLYISSIEYNQHISISLPASGPRIEFEYEDREDKSISYRSGFRVKTNWRLKAIKVRYNNEPVRRYRLSYDPSASTERSLLKNVTIEGADQLSTLPPLSFLYHKLEANNPAIPVDGENWRIAEFSPTEDWSGLNLTSGGDIRRRDSNGKTILDIIDLDGDARPDRVRYDAANLTRWMIQRNNGSGFDAEIPFGGIAHAPEVVPSGSSYWNGIYAAPGGVTLAGAYDIDGDGLTDRVEGSAPTLYLSQAGYTGFFFGVQLGTGLGFGPVGYSNFLRNEGYGSPSSNRDLFASANGTTNVALSDMNGDGRPDHVMTCINNQAQRCLGVRINKGKCTQSYGYGDPKVCFQDVREWPNLEGSYLGVYNGDRDGNGVYNTLIDINADGLNDRVLYNAADLANFSVQFNNGTSFEPAEPWGPINLVGPNIPRWRVPIGRDDRHDNEYLYTNVGLIDVNADGLPDRLYRDPDPPYGNFKVQLNTGSGFSTTVNDIGNLQCENTAYPDWCALMGSKISDGRTYVEFLDIDGDGLRDFVSRADYAGGGNKFRVQRLKGPFPDLISEVSNGLGARVLVQYKPSSVYDNRDRDAAGNPTRGMLPFPVNTVSLIKSYDGRGGYTETNYNYEGGFFNGADSERSFAGFYRVEAVNRIGQKTVTYFHQGGGRSGNALGENFDFGLGSAGKAGTPFRIENWGSDGKLYSLTLNKIETGLYNPNPSIYQNSYYTHISQTSKLSFIPTNTPNSGVYRATAKKYVYDISVPRLTDEIDYGEVTLPNFATGSHVLNDIADDYNYTKTTTTYAAVPGFAQLPLTITVRDKDNAILGEQKFTYYPNGSMQTKGLYRGPNDYVSETYTYDQFGSLKTTSDSLGTVYTTDYDPETLFTLVDRKQVSAPGEDPFITELNFDPASGNLLEERSPAGITVKNSYDPFQRLEHSYSVSANGTEVWLQSKIYNYTPLYGSVTTVSNNGTLTAEPGTGRLKFATIFFDGLGREFYTLADAASGSANSKLATAKFYDNSGRLYFEATPYFVNSSVVPGFIDAAQAVGTIYEYDPIGRITRNVPYGADPGSPRGETRTTYEVQNDPWLREISDPKGNIKRSANDAAKRVLRVEEVTQDGTYITRYAYNFRGDITSITDHYGNITNFEFDKLGRRTALVDPDVGRIEYEYDNRNKVTLQRDERQQEIEYRYDFLGRTKEKIVYKSSGVIEDHLFYRYDEALVAGQTVYPGLLSKVEYAGGSSALSYDPFGRVIARSQTVSETGRTYLTSYTYDAVGRVRDTIYPGGFTAVRNTYDNVGNLKTVRGVSGPASGQTFYEARNFDRFNRPIEVIYGNGVQSVSTFYPKSARLAQLRTTRLRADGSTEVLQNLIYRYDKLSNITSISDLKRPSGPNSASLGNIQYDELDRLKSYERPGQAAQYFNYDAIGNILSNTETGINDYDYESNLTPHILRSSNASTLYDHDPNGNMVRRGNSDFFTYDAQNRLTLVNRPGVTVEFGYNHDGGRIWKRAQGNFTVWIGGLYEEREGKELCHIYAGSKRVATLDQKPPLGNVAPMTLPGNGSTIIPNTYLRYYHLDHLQSTNIVTDRSGSIKQHYEYNAFGSERLVEYPESFTLTSQFTGQEYDQETGLYYFRSRYYDPDLGRFIQPDSIVPNVGDPQSLNPYAYVRNNPLKYADPSGHVFEFVVAMIIGAVLGGAEAAILDQDIGTGLITGAIMGLFGTFGAEALPYGGMLSGAISAERNGEDPVIGVFLGTLGASGGIYGFTGKVQATGLDWGGQAKNLGWWVTTRTNQRLIDETLSHYGIDRGYFNVGLGAVSWLGNRSLGSRYFEISTDEGTFGAVEGFGGRQDGAWTFSSALKSFAFDTADLLLASQGLLTASARDAINANRSSTPLVLGNSMGSFDVANLVAQYPELHFGFPDSPSGLLAEGLHFPIGMTAPAGMHTHINPADPVSGFLLSKLFNPTAEITDLGAGNHFSFRDYATTD